MLCLCYTYYNYYITKNKEKYIILLYINSKKNYINKLLKKPKNIFKKQINILIFFLVLKILRKTSSREAGQHCNVYFFLLGKGGLIFYKTCRRAKVRFSCPPPPPSRSTRRPTSLARCCSGECWRTGSTGSNSAAGGTLPRCLGLQSAGV